MIVWLMGLLLSLPSGPKLELLRSFYHVAISELVRSAAHMNELEFISLFYLLHINFFLYNNIICRKRINMLF